ncbi:MAG: tRNA1(Val) (adenine(37)-N6)-methyltransferase [Bacillota bacterium]
MENESALIRPGERVDFLLKGGMRIIQHPGRFRFGMDAVLLADFAPASKEKRVLDLGTGTGIIPLLLLGWGKASRVDGLEIQEDLADMARRSAVLNKFESGINILTGDLRRAEEYLPKNTYEAVVCNPPYLPVRAGALNKNASVAASKLEIYCTVEDVVSVSSRMLRSRGRLCLVYKPERFARLAELLYTCGLIPRRLRWVHSRAGEKAELVLIEAEKGGKDGLTVLPPLIVYDEKGEYTAEMQGIYNQRQYCSTFSP